MFHNLLAEGAFEVSAVRKGGKTRMVRIKSLAGEPCSLKTGLAEPVYLDGGEAIPIAANEKGVVTLKLEKGQEAVLVENGAVANLSIEALPLDSKNSNLYGSK